MIKVRVSPDFKELKSFLKSLPATFESNGETLKDDRNEIKIIQSGEHKLCVKSFNKVTAFNRLMYSWFRGTKAKRSYSVARRLQQLGIDTPQPVGYVEVYGQWHIIQKAFYISLYLDHQYDMKDVLESNIDCQEIILSSFAQHMAAVVHPAGAWHNDLSPGNVLINSKGDNEWKFSFIDLNRLTFKRRIPPVQGLANLKKLTIDPVTLALLADQYAIEAERNPRLYSLLLQRRNLQFSIRRFFIKKVLGVFKPRKRNT